MGSVLPRPGTRLPLLFCLALMAVWGVYGALGWWRDREKKIFFEEVLQPLYPPHVNDEGYWVGDIAENYRLGKISRKVAEADTAPLNPLVPKPIPIHGYYVRAMNSGPGSDPSPISFKGMKRCRDSWAMLIYPAEPGSGKPTYLFACAFLVRYDNWIPSFDFPPDKKGWTIVD